MNPIRTFLADDHAVLRDSLKVFLSLHPDLVLIGEAGDGLDTVHEVLRLKPDVLVLDLSLPTLSGLEVAQRIRHDLPTCKIVVLTQYQHPEQALPVLCAGANGYLLKKSGGNELVHAMIAATAEVICREATTAYYRSLGAFLLHVAEFDTTCAS